MYGRLILFFLLLPASGFARPSFEYLTHKTYADKYISLDTAFFDSKYTELDSTTYFLRLSQLIATAEKANDDELLLDALFIKANYHMVGHDFNRPKFLKIINELKETADAKKLITLQIRARHTLGYYYFYIAHAYGPGFEHYIGSYNLLKNVSIKEFPNKQQYLAEIGSAYYQFGDYDNARKILYEAQKYPPSFRKRFAINMTNTLGLIYREKRQFDSAAFFFRKAYELARKNNDSTWMGISAGNIGIVYYLKNQFDKAIPLLKLDVQESIKANERDNAGNSLIILAKIYLAKDQPENALAQIKQVQQMLSKTGDPYKLLKEIYPILGRISMQAGNFQNAYRYADSALTITDSLHTRRNSQDLIKAEQKVAVERYRAERKAFKKEAQFRQLLFYSALAIVLLGSIIIILVINRKRLLLKQTQQQLQLEKQTVETNLEMAVRQLEDFTNRIREKNDLIEKFANEIESRKFNSKESEQEATKLLEQLTHATLLTDAQWEQFREMFEMVHTGFLQRMREKLPALSPADTRYIVLSKLNLNSKEMAAMLGVRPDAIRLYRHRLRKRLGLTGENELEELINNI